MVSAGTEYHNPILITVHEVSSGSGLKNIPPRAPKKTSGSQPAVVVVTTVARKKRMCRRQLCWNFSRGRIEGHGTSGGVGGGTYSVLTLDPGARRYSAVPCPA